MARSCPGGTGQPGRQLNGTSAAVSGPDTAAENAGHNGPAGAGLGLGAGLGERAGAGVADGALAADAATGCPAAGPAQPAASRITAPAAPADITTRPFMAARVRR